MKETKKTNRLEHFDDGQESPRTSTRTLQTENELLTSAELHPPTESLETMNLSKHPKGLGRPVASTTIGDPKDVERSGIADRPAENDGTDHSSRPPHHNRQRNEETEPEDPSVASSDGEPRPGAVRVGGRDGTTNDDDLTYSNTTVQRHDQQQQEEASLIHAEQVDEAALAARYQEMARETIRERIQAESAHATEVTTSEEDHQGVGGQRRPKDHIWRSRMWIVVGVVGMVIVAVVVISVSLSSRRPPTPERDEDDVKKPPPTDFEYLQQQFVEFSFSSEVRESCLLRL